jgi:hypothetical protein
VARVNPLQTDEVIGIADGILGADAFAAGSLTIDYSRSLVAVSRRPMRAADVTTYHFRGAPSVPIRVDGQEYLALVDSASPDGVTLPGEEEARRDGMVKVGGASFQEVVRYAPIDQARIGNRVLARFLVSIDYRRATVALWPDPRFEPTATAAIPAVSK